MKVGAPINRPCLSYIMHYVIASFFGYCLIYFGFISGKRVVRSTAIIEMMELMVFSVSVANIKMSAALCILARYICPSESV